MGGLGSLMDKMPGMGQVPDAAKAQMDDKNLRHMVAIINSMTPKERSIPTLINGSRRKRIANGSGTSVQQVNQVMKQYKQMSKMMKKRDRAIWRYRFLCTLFFFSTLIMGLMLRKINQTHPIRELLGF